MFRVFVFAFAASVLIPLMKPANCGAAIFAAGAFSGEIYRFETSGNTFQQSTFTTIPGAGTLSGLTYRASENAFYVSDIFGSAIHKVDATSGVISQTFSTTGIGANNFGPTGLAFGPDGRLYASGFGSTAAAVYVLNNNQFTPAFSFGNDANAMLLNSATGGVGFVGSDLVFSTFGAGVYRFGGVNIAPFPGSSSAVAQIAVDASNQVFVGSSDLGAFGPPISANSVYRFDASGNPLSPIVIDSTLLPAPAGTPSSNFTSPSGVFIDPSGNLIVGALGRTSPANDPLLPPNGGLFMFNSTGQLTHSLTGIKPLSSVTFAPTAVPEPSSAVLTLGLIIIGMCIVRRRASANQALPMIQ